MPDPVAPAVSASDQGPEWRLLCASARSTLRPTDVERIAGICQQPLDWPLFLSLVARHRVAPLVWQSLRGTGETSIPDQARNELGLRVKRNALKSCKWHCLNLRFACWTRPIQASTLMR